MNLEIIARHKPYTVNVTFAVGGISLGTLEIPTSKWNPIKNLLGAGAANSSEVKVRLDEE